MSDGTNFSELASPAATAPVLIKSLRLINTSSGFQVSLFRTRTRSKATIMVIRKQMEIPKEISNDEQCLICDK